MSDTARKLARQRLVVAYELLESVVEMIDQGQLDHLILEAGGERGTTADEGQEAVVAVDSFAQQLGFDLAGEPHTPDTHNPEDLTA